MSGTKGDDSNSAALSSSENLESDKSSSVEGLAENKGPSTDREDLDNVDGLLEGWRFWFTMIGVNGGTFLVTLEMTIVITALVPITNEFEDFKHSTWVANAYFITWSGFLILWAQFSHVVGRKSSLLLSIGGFVVFSAACAAAQTAVQLYVFRGLQGLTGAGVFSLPYMILTEAIPKSKMAKYVGIITLATVVAFSIGPLIGGAITANTTWRWVFIINVPIGCTVFLLVLLALPNQFPHQHKPKHERPRLRMSSFKQLDVIGGTLFLGLAVLSVTALQEVAVSYPWKSATIICLLIFSGLSAVAFAFWERYITTSGSTILPVMSYHFAQRRTIAMFASAFLIGFPFIFTMVQIPQQFQVVDGLSPLQAGVRLLPYSVMVPTGVIVASILYVKRHPNTPIYGMLIGAVIQLVAVICFATDSTSASQQHHPSARQYGFQILMGLGTGWSYTVNLQGIYSVVGGRKELVAPATGVISQFRYLGAALGLGAATAAFNTYVRAQLLSFISADEISSILQSTQLVATLSTETQAQVLKVFLDGFKLEWEIMCGFVGLQIIAMLFTY